MRIVCEVSETQLEVEPSVHSQSSVSQSDGLEARLLELAGQGIDDVTIAGILTNEGHRSARSRYVSARTVRTIRHGHRILYKASDMRNQNIAGWLTIAMVAKMLGVSDSWLKRRIRSGIIQVQRDLHDKRFLVPDTVEARNALQELKSGTRHDLAISPRAGN